MVPLCVSSIVALCLLLWAKPVTAVVLERSLSTSRQFLVYGNDVHLRGVICDLAEKTKRDLLQLIDQRDEWITPIVVSVQYPQANLPETPRTGLQFAQTGFGLKLQLNLQIDPNVTQLEVRRELLRVILIEMMYRHKTDLPAGTNCVAPPAWLTDGIPIPESDSRATTLIDILGGEPGKILPLQEFLRFQARSDLDGPSRLICGAYSVALVEFLIHTNNGRRRLAQFIADLPFASNDPTVDLGSHFPELNNTIDAEKTWKSHIEKIAGSQPLPLFTVEETGKRLHELLVITIGRSGARRKFCLEEFPKFVRDPSGKAFLVRLSLDLTLLATRAHPICRPSVHAYAKIAALLARGKTNGIRHRLIHLEAWRKRTAARARKIDDYMNWFEATKSCRASGMFTEYLKAAQMRSQPTQRRHDPISVYLNVLETQFED